MLSTGAVNVDALISRVAPLSEGVEWFDRLRPREPGLMKVILQPWKLAVTCRRVSKTHYPQFSRRRRACLPDYDEN